MTGIAEKRADKFKTSRNCATEKASRRIDFLVVEICEIGFSGSWTIVGDGDGETERETGVEVEVEDIRSRGNVGCEGTCLLKTYRGNATRFYTQSTPRTSNVICLVYGE
jgi:hypothetical protein